MASQHYKLLTRKIYFTCYLMSKKLLQQFYYVWNVILRILIYIKYARNRLLIFGLVTLLTTILISPAFPQTSIIPEINQSKLDGQQLLQQGKSYYHKGQYQEAIKYLKQALPIFQDSNDALKQAITLSNLSLTYQQLADWEQAQKSIEGSLRILENNPKYRKLYAQSLDIQGRLWYLRGQAEVALKSLQQSTAIYQQLGDEAGRIGSLINQAQALQSLGLYQQALEILEDLQQALNNIPDTAIKAQALLSLGNVLRAVGELKQSQAVLQTSLTLVTESPSLSAKPEIKSAVLLSLANTLRDRGHLIRDRQRTVKYDTIPWRCQTIALPEESLSFYQSAALLYSQAISQFSSSPTGVQAQINYLSLLVETGKFVDAQTLADKISMTEFPGGRQGVYAQINLAKNLACLQQQNTLINPPLWQKVESLLATSEQQARKLQDTRALSYSLGNYGGFYEYLAGIIPEESQVKSKNAAYLNYLIKSQKLTQEALILALTITAPDITYQWEWQLGRLLALQDKQPEAIKFYQMAVASLKSVRNDLLAINSDVQFSYRDDVEPVYRGLVNLLLSNQDNTQSATYLKSAIENIDSLQLAELQNFLNCNLTQLVKLDQEVENIDSQAAFIYPIILEDRLDVIFKLPNQKIEHHVELIKRDNIQNNIKQLRQSIINRNVSKVREQSKEIYSWLIKPLEQYISDKNEIKTLVFVLDGEFRNIPMGILYDAQNNEYLIQKQYALALVPGLQIFDLKPLPINKLKVLGAGISEKMENVENHSFNPLNIDELQQIEKLLPTKLILNSQFTKINLLQQIKNNTFSVLHIATHGNFSSDPENTYILAYHQLLKAKDLNNLLRNNAIKLLILSACETAEGDNRAILGLAGLAVKAGAHSTISTLWQVNDDSTAKIMAEFYHQLKQGNISKAEALHQAQKALLNQPEYQNPYFWAPYILVGNWR
ncbi:tetratricopeptide TPR_2 repeat protein [Calothrix brevissima NIES-22]|nr:tetratricopeptide TPR_2 repeat protein [Calothrix brevissima NIES-22]